MITISLLLMVITFLLAICASRSVKQNRRTFHFQRTHYLKSFGYSEPYRDAKRNYNESILTVIFFSVLSLFFLTILLQTIK